MREKEEFIHHFREIQPKFSRLYARLLNQADLSLSHYALLNLLVGKKALAMTEVSGKLHVTKPAVTNLVDRLEKNRFLKRISHPKDRRVYLLEIQPKGEKIVRKIQTQILPILLKALEEFSPSERKTISRFYALLSKTMDQRLAEAKTERR